MDQGSSELNRLDDDKLEVIENSGTTGTSGGSLTPRAATSADVKASEHDVAEDLRKINDTGATDDDATAASAADPTAEPEQIREQIEQTRSQMSETINAIEEKLSFSNIQEQVSDHINTAVESAKGAVYSATLGKAENIMKTVTRGFNDVSESFGEAGTYAVRSAKRNPLPLALIGLGVGMLLMQNTRTKTYRYDYDENRGRSGGRSRRDNDSTFRQFASKGSGALSSAQETVTGAAGSAYESVSGAASSAYEGVSGAAGSAYEGVTSAAGSAYDGVTRFASSTGEQVTHVARRAQNQYERTLEDNPLAIGAIALAVGAVVGLAIPSTQYENEWMGEHKETLVSSVEDAARGAFEKVQEVAGEVTKQVQDQTGDSKAAGGGAKLSGSANIGGASISGTAKVSTSGGSTGGGISGGGSGSTGSTGSSGGGTTGGSTAGGSSSTRKIV